MKKIASVFIGLMFIIILIPSNNVAAQSTQDIFPVQPQSVYTDSEPIVISNNLDFVTQNWTGSGTQVDPYTISGLNISNTQFCITVSDTTDWFVIRDCYLKSNSSSGATVYLNNVTHGRIQDSFVGGEMTGFYLYNTDTCFLRRNSVRGLMVGVLLQSAIRCNVRESLVYRCEVGIRLDNSFECNIIENRVYANSETGIVATRFTRENVFYENYIGFNAVKYVQGQYVEGNAIDQGILNAWDDGSGRGNNWSDYVTNQTYQIPGLTESLDQYPSLLDVRKNPSLSGTSNLVFITGSIGHLVQWNASDFLPVSYQMYLNNRLIKQGWWENSQYTFNASLLITGVYNLTLAIYNGAGNVSRDQVFINVLEDVFSEIGTEYVVLASGLSLILVFLALYVIKRAKFE